MIVRCGRCRIELEVSGPGEFVCPSCGTRNAVRGAEAQRPDLGITVPGGVSPPPPPPPPDADIRWERCPACSYRFAMGETERIVCPNCRATLEIDGGTLRVAS